MILILHKKSSVSKIKQRHVSMHKQNVETGFIRLRKSFHLRLQLRRDKSPRQEPVYTAVMPAQAGY